MEFPKFFKQPKQNTRREQPADDGAPTRPQEELSEKGLARRAFLKDAAKITAGTAAIAGITELSANPVLNMITKKIDAKRTKKERGEEESDELEKIREKLREEYAANEKARQEAEIEENDVIKCTFQEQILAYIATGKEISLGQDTQKAIYQNWLEKYKKGSINYRDGIEGGLDRMKPWATEIKKIFQKYGVPEDFIYLAIAESNFKRNDVSGAGAVGHFQITENTAAEFDLKVDHGYDERLDPIKSAELCAKHLSESYERFGGSKEDRTNKEAWIFSLLAYNGGYANNFLENLSVEELDMPKKNMALQKENYCLKRGDNLYDIARTFKTSLPLLYRVNADEKKINFQDWKIEAQKIREGTSIRIPQQRDLSLENFHHYLEKRINDYIKDDLSKDSYTVRKNDTLAVIADRLDMKINDLLSLNIGRAGKYLRPGQILSVPKEKKKNMKYLLFILSDFKENINYPGKFFAIVKLIKDNHLEKIIESDQVTFLTKRLNQRTTLPLLAKHEKIDLEQLIKLNPAVKNAQHTILARGTIIACQIPISCQNPTRVAKDSFLFIKIFYR